MIYPADFESKIDFTELRTILESYCGSRLALRYVGKIRFSSSYDMVLEKLTETSEMCALVSSGVAFPSFEVGDLVPALRKACIQGTLISPEDAYSIARLAAAMQAVGSLFSGADGADSLSDAPVLRRNFGLIPSITHIREKIFSIIGPNLEILDSASPELAAIRRSMASETLSLSGKMKQIMDAAARQGLIEPNSSPSLRDGRVVMPVPSMNKRKLNGIVHDSSATGKTVFIEPSAIVETNNRIRELGIQEKNEINRILAALSDFIRPHIRDIARGMLLVARLDFIMAKARLAERIGAQLPHISRNPELEWYHAQHPVLLVALEKQNKTVVPLDIRIPREKRILIVSGPNAGGKSVALKTVGIVQYMMQCGLLPPLYSNSRMGIFRNILVDIGDEQSIENDLSTYSSHLRNMKVFLKHASKSTLFLADEMGSGTEPQIGGALAQAILTALSKKGAYGMVTTHYHNLKMLADTKPGFINGAMLYDRQRLKPLFRLSIGSPGSSFALEIARNAGLPGYIVEEAKEIVGSEYVDIDKYLLDITRDRKYWTEKKRDIKNQEARLRDSIEKYNQKLQNINLKRQELIGDARKQAENVLSGLNARIENTVRQIREKQAEKEATRHLRKQLDEYTKEVKKKLDSQLKDTGAETSAKAKPEEGKIKLDASDFKVGDYVKMSRDGVAGKIISLNKSRAEVTFGSLRSFVSLDSLIKTGNPNNGKRQDNKPVVTVQTDNESRKRQLSFNTTIDVRGMKVDEALQAILYFLDDANQFAAPVVRILHGTGTGALRQAVRAYLASLPYVRSFADEDIRFGGAGITVVNLE